MSRKPRTKASPAVGSTATNVWERVAWWALLAVPVAVPTAVAKIPFSGAAPWAFNLFVYPKIFALAWLVGISALAWVTGVATGAIQTRSVPLKWWLVSFLGLGVVSTVFAMNPTTSFFGGPYHAVGLLAFLLVGALAFLAVQMVSSAARLRAVSWATVSGGVIVAVIGLLQILGLDPLAPTAGPGFILARGASLLGNPDFTGTYLVLPMMVAAGLVLSEQTARDRGLAAVAFVLTASEMIATLTRGAWIGAAVGLVMLAIAYMRTGAKPARGVWIAAASALLLPVALILRDPSRALRQIGDLVAGGESGGGRLILWKDALAVVARHPIFGTGPDAYRLGWYPARSVASVKLSGLSSITEDPHNFILLLMATIGIPAAIAAIGLAVSSLYAAGGTALDRDARPGRLVYAGWWAAIGALCVALVFATNTASVAMALFLGVGVLAAARSKSAEYPAVVRYTLMGGLVALGVAGIVISTLSVSADMTLMAAQTSPEKSAMLDRAARTAPWYGEAVMQANDAFGEKALAELQSGSPQGAADAATAEARYNQAIAANRFEYKRYAALASFLNNGAATLGGDTLQKAVSAADGALTVYPVSAEAAYLKGAAQIGLGDASGAVTTLAPLWDIDPTYPNAGIMYAEALVQAKDLAKARQVIATLQVAFPDDPDVAAAAQRVNAAK